MRDGSHEQGRESLIVAGMTSSVWMQKQVDQRVSSDRHVGYLARMFASGF